MLRTWLPTRSLSLLALFIGLAHASIALWQGNQPLESDEPRYIEQAHNLTQGFFLSADKLELHNGPGYPLLLAPLSSIGTPIITLRLLNTLCALLGTLAWWHLARNYLSHRWALLFTACIWLHPILLRQAGLIMTENFSLLLLGASALSLQRALDRKSNTSTLLSILSLAILSMTRVIFGQVLLTLLSLTLLAIPLLKHTRPILIRTTLIATGSLLLCLPYLSYTKSITGKWFKWTLYTGELMYWTTSHHPGENGHWYSEAEAIHRPELAPNHAQFIQRILAAGPVKAEALYTEKIHQHLQEPLPVLKNYLCNWSRMFFGFPRSFEYERIHSLAAILPNGLLLLALLTAAFLAAQRRNHLPASLSILLTLALIYTGGSSLVPAQPRYFLMAYPLLLLPALHILSRLPWQALAHRSPG
jgi:4-amino-4-deoxy-L-arabinose transferase-like glycosyltransferase